MQFKPDHGSDLENSNRAARDKICLPRVRNREALWLMIRTVLNIHHLVLPHFMCTVGRGGLAVGYNEDFMPHLRASSLCLLPSYEFPCQL